MIHSNSFHPDVATLNRQSTVKRFGFGEFEQEWVAKWVKYE